MRRADFADLAPLRLDILIDGRTETREFIDFPAIGRAYCERVVSGEEPAGDEIIRACRRTLTMLERAEDPREPFYFSAAHVCDFCAFFELMPHIESGEWEYTGNPYQVLEPHMIWEFMHINGFRRRRTHERLTSRAWIEEPRKNAKSGRAAIVALYELISDSLSPQVLIGAATEKQANRVYDPALTLANGVRQDDGSEPNPNTVTINARAAHLRARYGLDSNSDRISCARNGGYITRVNSIGERNDGWNPRCIIMEEVHAQNRAVYEVLRSAFGAKPSALMYMISTAGRVAAGIAWDIRREALEIINGHVANDTFFAAVYTISDKQEKELLPKASNDQQVFNELMMVANPMWGVSIDPIKIWDIWQEALRQPHMRSEFLRTRLNLWGRAANAIITASDWDACRNPDLRLDEFEGERAWLALDLASRNDMAALGVVIEYSREKIAVFCEYFIPELSPYFEHPRLGNLYKGWVDNGYILPTGGGLVDFDTIEDRVVQLNELLDVQMVVCDNYQANQMVGRFLKQGIAAVVFQKNEANCTAATEDLSARAPVRQLLHNGHPVLAWNVSNAVGWRRVGGGIVPKKHDEASDDKIDGFDAIMMGNAGRLHLKDQQRKEDQPNVYAKRGARLPSKR